MYYYSISLRTASFLMVNSTWTKEHVDAILQYSNPVLDLVHCLPPLIFLKLFTLVNAPRSATIVYPPCDTKEISLFSLEHRERVILSLAQFRSVNSTPITNNDLSCSIGPRRTMSPNCTPSMSC